MYYVSNYYATLLSNRELFIKALPLFPLVQSGINDSMQSFSKEFSQLGNRLQQKRQNAHQTQRNAPSFPKRVRHRPAALPIQVY